MAINCVLVRWSDPENKDYNNPDAVTVLNYNAVLTNPVVIGLDPDLEYFVKREPYRYPQVDFRLQAVQVQEWISDIHDSEYPDLKVWQKTYSTISRSSAELKNSIDEEKTKANNLLFPTEKQFEYMCMYMAGVRRELNGLPIPPALQDIFDKAEDKIELIYQNHVLALQKKADVDANNPIDIDTGWMNTDPVNE